MNPSNFILWVCNAKHKQSWKYILKFNHLFLHWQHIFLFSNISFFFSLTLVVIWSNIFAIIGYYYHVLFTYHNISGWRYCGKVIVRNVLMQTQGIEYNRQGWKTALLLENYWIKGNYKENFKTNKENGLYVYTIALQ